MKFISKSLKKEIMDFVEYSAKKCVIGSILMCIVGVMGVVGVTSADCNYGQHSSLAELLSEVYKSCIGDNIIITLTMLLVTPFIVFAYCFSYFIAYFLKSDFVYDMFDLASHTPMLIYYSTIYLILARFHKVFIKKYFGGNLDND